MCHLEKSVQYFLAWLTHSSVVFSHHYPIFILLLFVCQVIGSGPQITRVIAESVCADMCVPVYVYVLGMCETSDTIEFHLSLRANELSQEFPYILNIFIDIQLIYSFVLFSGIRQSIQLYIHNCALQQVLVVYLFYIEKYVSLNPKLFICLTFPFGNHKFVICVYGLIFVL